ncbi:hypothetical protein DEM34_01150 [Spiribacter halobius]|uniref:Uncharacterized protein n=1 Tax=Sediminicurvatus halobius TaxID=2182432 RepID=A0A2U2N8I7_9GAMM|nr:hypothetical protein DEM34_01150 [Spiribacter halobius]
MAAGADLADSPALRSARVLDVLSSTPARPGSRAPCPARHLHALASRIGEICGLASRRVAAPTLPTRLLASMMAASVLHRSHPEPSAPDDQHRPHS